DPVVCPHGAGAVGTAGRVFVEGAGAPDMLAAAVDLGVVAGPDPVAVPGVAGGVGEQFDRSAFDEWAVPAAILDEGLQGLPVGGQVEGDEGLGDGVFFDVEDQAGEPLDEASEAGAGEAAGEGGQQGLPDGPESGSVHGAPR